MRKEYYREMKVIGKYYDVDETNKIVTINLHYGNASELIDNTIKSENNYAISDEVMENIENKVKKIPLVYKVRINLSIDDYEELDPKKLLENINDFLELNHYNLEREKSYNRLTAILLLVVGLSLIVFNVTAKNQGWYQDIAFEIFDIMSWVFIWEATTVAFLRTSELNVNSHKIRIRICEFILSDKLGEILASETSFGDNENWEGSKRIEKFARFSLLFSGAALIASAVVSLIGLIPYFSSAQANIQEFELKTGEHISESTYILFVIIYGALSITIYIATLFAGISALSTYIGRGPFRKKLSYVFMGIVFIMFALEISSFILVPSSQKVLTSILLIFSGFCYLVGKIVMIVINKKEEKEIERIERNEE